MKTADPHRGTSWLLILAGTLLTSLPVSGLQTDPGPAATVDEGVYAAIDLDDLEVFDLDAEAGTSPVGDEATGDAPVGAPLSARWDEDWRGLVPRVSLDGPGAVALTLPRVQFFGSTHSAAPTQLAVHLAEPREVRGRLFLPTANDVALVPLGFRIPAQAFGSADREAFWNAVASEAYHHITRRHSGSAWFRHVGDNARLALEEEQPEAVAGARNNNFGLYSLKGSFELLSGGRALSENLALDQLLDVSAIDEESVPIDSIEGVTVRAYDWDGLTADIDPELDTLATIIPADQHGLFFPSFAALLAVSDEVERLGNPALLSLESRSQTAHTRQRYEQQLGLSMSQLARLFGPHLIASVALTGGDAYLRTGSDVAVLFEAKDPLATLTAISARVSLAFANRDDVSRVNGEVEGVAYTGLVSADRSACSYIASVGPAVVVTNSTVQLARLVRAERSDVANLSALPEYHWFRDRYPLSSPDGSALLVLSDDTIRRWCGPRVRIGSSRRARAAAVLSELTARQISASTERLPGHGVPSAELADIGPVHDDSALVNAVDFGNLAFATPISELDLDQVSESEEAFYTLWRAGYERNWRDVFDPIAVQFSVSPEGLSLDTTVRPLIFNTEYERMARLSRGGLIEDGAGDPHPGALIHYALAADFDEVEVMPEMGMVQMLAPNLDVFGWMGTSVAFYVDDTEFWTEAEEHEDLEQFLFENFTRVPFAIHAEVSNGLKLALFLTGARGMIESTAPGMTTWETRTYRDQPYVCISESMPSEDDRDEFAVYYVSGDEGLTLTLSEALVWRVIDRRLLRNPPAQAGDDDSQPAHPSQPSQPAAEQDHETLAAAPVEPRSVKPWPVESWLGEHMALRLDGPSLARAIRLWGDDYFRSQRDACWRNLPILNVWHERFPDEDPVAVHERLFQRTLLCPSGGSFYWNEEFRTMESSAHGHPGRPFETKTVPPLLQELSSLAFGVSFEDDGLRARAQVVRAGSDH